MSERVDNETAIFESRVRRQLLGYVAVLPRPAQYAMRLPEYFQVALLTAIGTREGWFVRRQYAEELRVHGLVEYGGRGLTVFGMQVRRALVESIN